MKVANQKIREAVTEAKIRYWRIADVLGISPGYLSALLRHELPVAKRDKILKIISHLKETDAREVMTV